MTFSRQLKRTEQLLYRWGEEPIGVAVPFVAFLAVWLPPQMPDMFAGMETPLWQLKVSARPFFFAMAATLLGLSAWFWTRAALTARRNHSETDKARLRRKRARRAHVADAFEEDQPRHRRRHSDDDDHVAWSEEWAPRMALLFAGAITVMPILFAMRTGHFFSGLLGAELMSFGLVGLLFVFVVYRTEFRWMNAFDAPDWMDNYRATRIIADAPFGWPFAVLSLSCSLVALICVAAFPEFIGQFDAPTTALAALAFAVGPLVIALAIVRGLAERFIYLVRWIVNGGAGALLLPGEGERVRRAANLLGTVAMAGWLLSPPWVIDKHVVRFTETRIDEPAGAHPCPPSHGRAGNTICRPDLKTALGEWASARRRASPIGGRLPVIIVAAEGGASRAAVWMLSAMRMLDNRTNGDFGRHLFAISGVSGGSLGAATYSRMLRARGREDGTLDWDDPDTRAALQRFATKDLLSATIATYFLNDMFGSLVGPVWTWAGIPDRNATLENTFEAMWEDNPGFATPRHVPAGFLGLRFSPQSESRTPVELLPHLFLNGTDVNSGKRMITSTIRWTREGALFPDSGDFIQLASRDVRMATAVTNSARFPFISPAGRFVSAGAVATSYQIIDGGYFENYGARTVWELARAIEDANIEDPTLNVVPIVVVISNDLDADQPPRAKAGKCRMMLDDVSTDGNQVTIRCDEARAFEKCEIPEQLLASALKPQDQSIVPQSMAPIFGLAATRSAHGRDALNILKRDFCRAMTGEENDPRVRMIHIALPKPDPERGEAAPMNWVLNPPACDYMLNKAPWLPFNVRQADRLKSTLDAVLGVALRASQQDKPAPIDCHG